MRAYFVFVTVVLFILGCGPDYDSAVERMSPTYVSLPYHERIVPADAFLDIKPIPGRTDAVRVETKLPTENGLVQLEWTQEGCSVKKIPVDYGRCRYDFAFEEMRFSGDEVSEVKLSVVCRFNGKNVKFGEPLR